MRRQVWIDQPKLPDYPKLAAASITDCIFDARWLNQLPDPLGFLQDVRDKAKGPSGAYFCAQGADSLGAWPSWRNLTGKEWADWAYELLQHEIAPGTSGSFPLAHLNAEVDDVAWVLAALTRWCSHSPQRWTLWTPVAHKAPLFRSVGAKLAALNVIVGPQCYVGPDMQRVESANEFAAWVDIGIPAKNVWPVLDARTLGGWWGEVGGAVAFMQSGLP